MSTKPINPHRREKDMVEQIMASYGEPVTAAQVAARCGVGVYSIKPVISHLVKFGIAEPTGSCIDAKSGCKVKLYRLTPKPDNLVQTRDRTVSSELFKGVNWSASMQRPGCQDHLQVPSLRGNRRIPHRVFIGVAE